MTSLPLPADGSAASRRTSSRPRLRRPTTRSGVTWLIALLVIGTLLAVQVGRQVYANYSITEQADALRRQIPAIEAQNEALRRQRDYLNSGAFISAEARRLSNLGRRGDRLLIIPPGAEASLPPALQPKPVPDKPIIEQWVDLFFGG